MMDVVAQILVFLNTVANALGRWLLAPVAVLPGWLSATLVAAVTGVLLLIVFKYTSNQRAIKRVRDDISANLLAIKLFKESATVALRAQHRLVLGAGRLFLGALVPIVIMILPVTLILGQLSLWYQQRPLAVGEEAVVTVKLNGEVGAPLPEVSLRDEDGVETVVGPVRVFSQREVCWNLRGAASGYHRLVFQVGEQTVEKEMAIGDGFMRVSARRPERAWLDVLAYPAEQPFGLDSPVRSIAIDYPSRSSWTSGTDVWVVYWFIVSMIAALCFRGVFNVKV
jgi:hypothetical protein